MDKFKYPLPPFILGFVLHETFEINLRRGLQYSQGNILDIFAQPIATIFIIGTLLSLVLTIRKQYQTKKVYESKVEI